MDDKTQIEINILIKEYDKRIAELNKEIIMLKAYMEQEKDEQMEDKNLQNNANE